MNKKLTCPACRHEQLARIARHGFLRKKLLPVFGYYPWECSMCRRQFVLRKRGAAYRKATGQGSPGQQAAGSAVNRQGHLVGP